MTNCENCKNKEGCVRTNIEDCSMFEPTRLDLIHCWSCPKRSTCMAYTKEEREKNPHTEGCLNYQGYKPIEGPTIEDFKKASELLHKKTQEPDLEFGGYNIFVNPIVGECMKGLKKTMEAKDQSIIRSIQVNKPKRIVTVVFKDGCVELIKCHKEDDFDVNIGVALAIAKHLYGSKNKFHKEVLKKTRKSRV